MVDINKVEPSYIDSSNKDLEQSVNIENIPAERDRWSNRIEFILVTMGYAVGVGNLWRFPYLVGKYGGGAFLIPYFLSLIFVAGPLYLIEMIIGQKFQRGAVDAFHAMHPAWTGLGYASMFLVFLLSSYYQLLLVYSLLFLGNSFRTTLPWTVNSSTTFYHDHILHRSSSILAEGSGEVQPSLVLGLLVIWILIFLILFKGIKASGKVVYITVTLPFILLFIMVIKCVQLPGAKKGLIYYLYPRFKDLLNFDIWAIACGQILFSLSPGMGTTIALASFNKEDEDIYVDNIIIIFANSFFSMIGGFVVFSVVGYIAEIENKDVSEVAKSGPSLAFITFAEALGTFGSGWCQFFSVLFYMMLLTLGIDSSLAWVETLNAFITDLLTDKGIRNFPGELICLGTCITIFLFGILYTIRSGLYWLDIVDHYVGVLVLLFIVFLEYVLVAWVYGIDKIIEHMHEMTGRRLGLFWHIQPKYIGPSIVIILAMSSLIKNIRKVYGSYPFGPTAFGWSLFIINLIVIPIYSFTFYMNWQCKCLRKNKIYDTEGKLELLHN